MYVDQELMFADAQVPTDGAASTNVIDLGVSRDVGTGRDVYFNTGIVADMTGTLVATLQASDVEGFGSGVETILVHTYGAGASAGEKKVSKLPALMPKKRYLRVLFEGGTVGSVDAFLNNTVDARQEYESGYTVNV